MNLRPAIALVLCASLIGCPAQSTIASLTSILGSSASSIAALEGNSPLAQKIMTDTQAAVTAVQNWKSGTPAQEAIEALNLVEDDLNLIPAVGPYVALIDLAIGTVESILTLLPSPSVTANVRPAATRRQVVLPVPPKTASQYKAQWNAIVAQNPSLVSAKLK